MATTLDHLVLVTSDLEAGMLELARRTGVEPVLGGSHPGLGTHNALLGLSWGGLRRCYLELLAPDPSQSEVPGDRTMLDLGARLTEGLGETVRPHTWVVRPDDLDATLAAATDAGVEVGEVVEAARARPDGTVLSWRLAVPRPLGLGGVQPSLIDWGPVGHPSDTAGPGLELEDLVLEHPDPARARRVLDILGVDHHVGPGDRARLTFVLRTPRGRVVLR